MKRVFLTFIFAVLILMASSAAIAEATTTLLVYMCGTDLQEAACIDLYEMADAETSEDMNIVVLAGGAESWSDEDLSGNTRNLITISGRYFTSVDDVGQASMGNPESLLEFLEYGLTEYPADRTIVVLWDHGAGSEGGICFDETADYDGLTLTEINEVLYQLDDDLPDYHIDIFGCDACMMATYEMASLLSHYNIDYFIASEELEPGCGWYYTPWLAALDDNPDLSNEELCTMIAESYMEDGLACAPYDALTLSAVDLGKVGALTECMEEFAGTMASAIEGGELAAVRRGRSRIYTFGSFCNGSWDMVDMQAVLNAYSEFSPDSVAIAKELLEAAVVVNRQTDNLELCSGLSMLIPQDTCETFDYYSDGYDISFYLPNWVSFVNEYVSLMNGSDYSFGALVPDQIISGTTVSAAPSSLWDIDWQGMIGSEEEHIVGDTDYGFSIQLTAEDMENLDYVEGMLLMDVSDDEMLGYVDLGLTQNNLFDWQNSIVYSMFDGSWPTFDGQLVPLYDQTVTEHTRRSLVPVKLNGDYTYLVVVFRDGSTEGRIIGANAGYDNSGFPIRETTKLNKGDIIIPVYTLYYMDVDADEDADFEESEFEGDPISWEEGMTITYASLNGEDDDDEPLPMQFCFVLNDIFGDSEMSDLIAFEL